MRRTVIALVAVTALLAGCQPPAEAPADAPADAAVATPPAPEMPADAPPQEEVDPAVAAASPARSCTQERGAEAAVALASRCTQVSPASHPPCNPDNPCQLIQDEIDRSCAIWKRDGNPPAECAA